LIGDVLFSEIRDCNRILIPEYGTPHPDTNKWPNHKLVFVKPVDIERNEIFEFFYAADRENQDDYNFEFGSTQIGNLLVDIVTRTYVILRSEFYPSADEFTVGADMPDTPAGKFTGAWTLYDTDQKRIGQQELDSLFVVVQNVYVKPKIAVGETYGRIVTEEDTITAVVAEDTPADTGIDIISSQVTPLGNGTSIKVTKSVQGGVWPDPIESTISKTRDNMIPQKFRGFVTRFMKSRKVADVPETITLAGDEIAKDYTRETPDRVDEKVTEEIIDENIQDLEGEQYGKIVTVSTFESLVEEGTLAETGINVISSIVTPLGNGKSVKQDEIVKDGWPDPVEVSRSSPAENLPPSLYRDNLQRTVTTRKVASIPDSVSLGGNVVGVEYKQETPDRAEEQTTEQTFEIYGGDLAETVERRVYLETRSFTDVADEIILPEVGSGSSRMVYRSGDSIIYENTKQETTAIETYKGTDTKAQAWGAIIEESNYTIDPTLPAGGSSVLVHNDGQSVVYENVDVSVEVSGSTVNNTPQEWGVIKQNGEYELTPIDDFGVTSRQVWSNGVTQVYLNETNTVEVGGSTVSNSPQAWGAVKQNGTYSETPEDGFGVTSRQVWSDGVTQVYLNETNTVEVGGSTAETDPQAWGSITWNGTYDESPDGLRSRQVWSDGVTQVYLNEDPTLTIEDSPFISAREESSILIEEQETSYGSTPSSSGTNTRSALIFSIGEHKVYENVTITVTPKPMREYGGVIDYAVPSVLQSIGAKSYPRRDGTSTVYYEPVIKEGFSGSFPCRVQEVFEEDPVPPTVLELQRFSPAPVAFSTPFGSLNIAPTLHGSFTIPVNTGSRNPIYELVAETIVIPATNVPDWEGMEILAAYSTTPYKSGFIVRKYYIDL
jgi:hypothetical protein